MDAREKQWDARNKQWKKVVWVCLIVFAAGSVLNTLTEDLYIAAYVSLVGKDGALILGTLTHICFLIPAFIVFRKLSPPRKMRPKEKTNNRATS